MAKNILEYEKMHRNKKAHPTYSAQVAKVRRELSLNKQLNTLAKDRDFNRQLYEKGIEFFNAGGIIEEAPEEVRNDVSFVTGYNKAKRTAMIAEMEEKRKSR